MINPEIIYNNLEKFSIYPSHQEIYDKILTNININKKFILYGERFCGKSFFCRKLALKLIELLKLDNIKIIDFPLVVLNKLYQNGIQNLNSKTLKEFMENRDINRILKIEKSELIILDEINSTIFEELSKFNFHISTNQIFIQVIGIKGLYMKNKQLFDNFGYKLYELGYPNYNELINMIKTYNKISKENIDYSIVLESKGDKNTFRSLFL
ncbi:MAG: hypothetical protein ACFFDF_18920 [Candidatus Odinarchaeota archaeon]